MSTQPLKEVKPRKPRARQTAVVLGALQERVLAMPLTDEVEFHRDRMLDLLDELTRSLNRGTEEE